MEEKFRLEANSRPIELAASGITLVAPGLRGEGTYLGALRHGETRRASAEKSEFDQALRQVELGDDKTLEDRHTLILDARVPPAPQEAETRTTRELGSDEIYLQVPSGKDELQFVYYKDEAGVVSFHFPGMIAAGQALPTRAPTSAELRTYRIRFRRPSPAAASRADTRGMFGWLGKKIIKVVVGKVAETVVGWANYGLLKLWENNWRKFESFHSGALGELLGDTPTPFDDWGKQNGQRSLLFIHGTTSTTAGAFASLKDFPRAADQLYAKYQARVLGFNHHTLTDNVAENVVQFYDALKNNPGTYEFDVICHSRGGLLARALVELDDTHISNLHGTVWSHPTGVTVNIARIVFVGTPNNGTELAATNNLPKMLDRAASIINLLPDSAITLALGSVFATAASIAAGVLRSLPGLADQAPGSDFLTRLNSTPPKIGNYYAVQANYEPTGGLIDAIKDSVADRLFGDRENDLIVPTASVSSTPQFSLDAANVLAYGRGDKVHHTVFFTRGATWDYILTFLGVA